jgi:hypothetical protein
VSLAAGASLGAAAGNAIDSGTKRTGAKRLAATVSCGVDIADAGFEIAGVDDADAARPEPGDVDADPKAVGAAAVGEESVTADRAAEGVGATNIGVASIALALPSSRSIVAKNMATAPTRTPHARPSRSSTNLRRKRTVGAK